MERYTKHVPKRYETIEYWKPHAIEQMRARNIGKNQVERCLQKPDRESISKTHSKSIQAEYDTEHSTIIVWYERLSASHALVKSAVRRKKK